MGILVFLVFLGSAKGLFILIQQYVPVNQLIDFGRSLLSKVQSDYTIEIEPPGFEDRIAILEDEMDLILVK